MKIFRKHILLAAVLSIILGTTCFAEDQKKSASAFPEFISSDTPNPDHKQAVDIKAERFDLYVRQAYEFVHSGRYDEALASAMMAQKIDGQSDYVENLIGMAYYFQGHSDKALPHFRKALYLKPDSLKYRKNLGLAMTSLGQHEQAASEFNRVISKDPKNTVAWYRLGMARSGSGDADGALEAFKKALELDEQYPYANYEISKIYFNKGDYASAWLGIHRARDAGFEAFEQDFVKALSQKMPEPAYTPKNKRYFEPHPLG